MNYIEPRPGGDITIKLHKHLHPHDAKKIAQQILDVVADAHRMPIAGHWWMRCRRCGQPLYTRGQVGPHPCYEVK